MPIDNIRIRLAQADLDLPEDAFKAKLATRLRVAYAEAFRAYAQHHGGLGGQPERPQTTERSEPVLIHAGSGARLKLRARTSA